MKNVDMEYTKNNGFLKIFLLPKTVSKGVYILIAWKYFLRAFQN